MPRKVGRVVQIRVNPKDCMAVVDVIQAARMHFTGMSFAQAVSTALACAMESFRQNNIVPTRDGFEYTAMMEPFPDNTTERKKLYFKVQTNLDRFSGENSKFPVRDLRAPTEEEIRSSFPDPEKSSNPRVRILLGEIKQMEWKRDHEPENFDQAEYDRAQNAISKLIEG